MHGEAWRGVAGLGVGVAGQDRGGAGQATGQGKGCGDAVCPHRSAVLSGIEGNHRPIDP